MAPSSKSSRVRPSDIAADTKRNFIPLVKRSYSNVFPQYSILYHQPIAQLSIHRRSSTRPPSFHIEMGDPVMRALAYSARDTEASEVAGGPRIRVPFICAANERRPGGDWETGCTGYEEKLCRRSTLSAALSAPHPDSHVSSTNYPIPSQGGILSDSVVVYRGPHDRYEKLDSWFDMPVVSVPPTRWPKLKENGLKYSFAEEREMTRDKLRGALRICLYNNYDRVVIGDFGLGNGYRNPPQELAELWRDVILFDPDLRGQFSYVVFVFEDPHQSTMRNILDEMAKKDGGSSRSSKSRSGTSSASSSSRSHRDTHSSGSSSAVPTDWAIFEHVFSPAEVDRVLRQPDPRYGLGMITT